MASLLERMRADTGYSENVAVYLLAKLAHVALLAWLLVTVAHVPALWAALAAALGYTLIGKVLWCLRHDWSFGVELRDTVFDLLLVLIVAVPVLPIDPLPRAGVALAWLLLMFGLDSARWGSPS